MSRTQFLCSRRALSLFAFLFFTAPFLAAAPSVSILKVIGLQPGWVRATAAYQGAVSATFTITPTCGGGTRAQSVIGSTPVVYSNPTQIAVLDLRVNPAYEQNNGLPTPCQVTALQVQMFEGTQLVASSSTTISFPMDLPLSLLTPAQFANPPLLAFIPLQLPSGTSRYAAYPPRIIGIRSQGGFLTSFLELEELPELGTVGIRGWSSFYEGGGLYAELGGGAEIFPGWGVSIINDTTFVTGGVLKDTSGPAMRPVSKANNRCSSKSLHVARHR
jgi:hypothetical protein